MTAYLFPKRAFAECGEEYPNLLKDQTLQIGLAESQTTSFDANESVILDFGEELSGGIRILTFHGKNVPVRIRFGESLGEACSELGGHQNATNDHSLRDFSVLLQDYYPEFENCIGQCRFTPCYHHSEPGCAVRQAVDEGKIHPERYERYRYLLDVLKKNWRERYD